MNFAIQTEQLSRTYKIRMGKKGEPKQLVALTGVDLQVNSGELFGLLGPNGAGKTTLIKILTTLLTPSSGKACVAGYDVTLEPDKVRHHINMVSGGESSGYGLLTVRENLWMFSQFYGMPSKQANQRIKEMLETFGIADRINTKSSDLSTGLRQKMNIIRGFLTDPDVLFLDEPTLGLDVGASKDVRSYIHYWVENNPSRTILLTTHYMVEADELCDRVAIINKGQVLACDSPANLKRHLQQDAIFRIQTSPLNGTPIQKFHDIPGVRKLTSLEEDGSTTIEMILAEDNVLSDVVALLTSENLRILNLQKREPTLEDVFIDLVGRSMAEVERVEDEKQ